MVGSQLEGTYNWHLCGLRGRRARLLALAAERRNRALDHRSADTRSRRQVRQVRDLRAAGSRKRRTWTARRG